MSPLLVALALACAVLLVLVVALAVAVVAARRRAVEQEQVHGRDLAVLREQVGELTARQAELENRASGAADYVITFDETEPEQVATQRVVSATLGEPLIKVASFGHGVRRALREERRAHLAYQVRREYRRRRKASRAAARRAARQRR